MNLPLFLNGPALCGTNLVKAILGVHPEIHLESEPFVPLFRSLRNAILSSSKISLIDSFNPESPMGEYYFLDERLEVMDLIQKGDLNIPFNDNELDELKKKIANRMHDYVPHLIQYIDLLDGRNYKELFTAALDIVSMTQKNNKFKWRGWLDSWVEEFFPLLAREYSEARFILIFRDPRAAIASSKSGSMNIITEKFTPEPLTLSYLRCWRKQLAFAKHFQGMDLFKDRLHIICYEDLIENADNETKKMCEFLEIDFYAEMLDTNKFMGLGKDTGQWTPNSSFLVPKKGIYKNSLYRWKNSLSGDWIKFIEFVVGVDLKYFGYKRVYKKGSNHYNYDIYDIHNQEHFKCQGWRTDIGIPEIDLSLEIVRNQCLEKKIDDEQLIRKCFLFPEIYESLLRIM